VGSDSRPGFCHIISDVDTYLRLRSHILGGNIEPAAVSRFLDHLFPRNKTQDNAKDDSVSRLLMLSTLEQELDVYRPTIEFVLYLLTTHPQRPIVKYTCKLRCHF
jgi:hypothetical protein